MLPLLLAVSLVGLDVPERTATRDVGPSELTEGVVREKCLVFARFAVLEVNDPGNKGAVRIEVRPRAPKSDPCTGPAPEGTRVLEAEGYLAGASGPYVFVNGADGFGDVFGLDVFDARTGARVLSTERHQGKPVRVTRRGEVVSLRFVRVVEAPCSVAKERDACVRRLRTELGVPAKVRLKPPPCANDDARQVGFPVAIADVARPVITFESGATTCGEAP